MERYAQVHFNRDALIELNRALGFPDNHGLWAPISTARMLGIIRSEKRAKRRPRRPSTLGKSCQL